MKTTIFGNVINRKQIYMQPDTSQTLEGIILRATCLHFGLNLEDFIKAFDEVKRKDQNFCYPRFICIYLLREKTLLSYFKLSEKIHRSESSIKNGYNNIRGLVEVKDRRVIADLKDISDIIDNFIAEKKQTYA